MADLATSLLFHFVGSNGSNFVWIGSLTVYKLELNSHGYESNMRGRRRYVLAWRA